MADSWDGILDWINDNLDDPGTDIQNKISVPVTQHARRSYPSDEVLVIDSSTLDDMMDSDYYPYYEQFLYRTPADADVLYHILPEHKMVLAKGDAYVWKGTLKVNKEGEPYHRDIILFRSDDVDIHYREQVRGLGYSPWLHARGDEVRLTDLNWLTRKNNIEFILGDAGLLTTDQDPIRDALLRHVNPKYRDFVRSQMEAGATLRKFKILDMGDVGLLYEDSKFKMRLTPYS